MKFKKTFICSIAFNIVNYQGSILTISSDEIRIWHILKRLSIPVDNIKAVKKYNRWYNSICIESKESGDPIYIHSLQKKSILMAFQKIGINIEYCY